MNAEFSNINDLKKRLMPALKIRVNKLKDENINVTCEELWNYFSKIWKNCHDLTLADLVDDVLNKKLNKMDM